MSGPIVFPPDLHARQAPLRLAALACVRGMVPVFDNLSTTLAPGEALALYGPNGSGKTSLLRILAGLLPQAAGHIEPPPQASAAHYLAHAEALKPLLSVDETLTMQAGLYGLRAADAAAREALLAALGLSGRARQAVGDLSAGQKRRLTLARLLLAPRPLWLLDEPFTALDEAGRALLKQLAMAHKAAGGMLVAASHEPLDFANKQLTLTPPEGL